MFTEASDTNQVRSMSWPWACFKPESDEGIPPEGHAARSAASPGRRASWVRLAGCKWLLSRPAAADQETAALQEMNPVPGQLLHQLLPPARHAILQVLEHVEGLHDPQHQLQEFVQKAISMLGEPGSWQLAVPR